jgi:hypothetical protein
MKKFIPIILALFIFISVYSCGDSGSNVINAVVTFAMSHFTNATGDTTWFAFKPSIDIRIDSIQNKLPANNYSYTTRFVNSGYTYSKDTTYYYDWFTGVQSGQQWEFYFFGTYPSNNSKFSNIKSTYTVP